LKKRQEQEGGHLLKENSDTGRKKTLLMETKIDELSKIRESCKLMERAVVQNSLCDIAIDFKFYEDPSDEFIGHEGTLMPLWNFRYKGTKHLTVSALCWNRRYLDMFAVGMGTEDYFDQQCGGMVLIYSLKNPTYPEYAYKTASGVRCVDIHPHKSYLVAAGFYDGNVAVYNLKVEKLKPVCASSPETGKHMDPVIQLCWQKDDINNNHNFYSVSLDGQIVSWTLVKVNMHVYVFSQYLEVLQLYLLLNLSFDPLYGQILVFFFFFQCSMTYTGHPMEVYDAHLLSVGTVKWNPFHPKVFISCSCDMTVKIWDHTVTTPISNIDLKEPVEDVAFSPHTSTVFAAVTRRGTVYFYDVSISIYEAICQQEVVNKRKGQLTKLEFNPIHLIIIIGDGKGCIHSFKLSPNLRKRPKNKKGQEIPIDPQEEVGKLEKFLISRLNARQSAP
uniref:Dynein, axonemal, intermediate chain 1, paralog 2 n=1 Tax=Oryzias latipes TaxID=8090 RepID=A0A3B3IF74_ORYLA